MGWLRAHKVLVAVYGFGLTLAAIELAQPAIDAEHGENPRWFLDAEANIVDASNAVSPERATSLYYRAFQASLCTDASARNTLVCLKRGPVRPGEIRELMEEALATGNRSIELLQYNYAIILIQDGAPQAEIDAAVRNWRVTNPSSSRPDPRVLFAQTQRKRTTR